MTQCPGDPSELMYCPEAIYNQEEFGVLRGRLNRSILAHCDFSDESSCMKFSTDSPNHAFRQLNHQPFDILYDFCNVAALSLQVPAILPFTFQSFSLSRHFALKIFFDFSVSNQMCCSVAYHQ